MKTKPIVLMLICLLVLAECFAGCSPTPANQVAVILADTNYYQRRGNEYIKESRGLEKGQKVLVTWKTEFINDNSHVETLVSCLLPGANGDFIGGQEIYVPKRNKEYRSS